MPISARPALYHLYSPDSSTPDFAGVILTKTRVSLSRESGQPQITAFVLASSENCNMLFRFITYRSTFFPSGVVGLIDEASRSVAPVSFPSGQPVTELYDLIEAWDELSGALIPGTFPEDISEIEITAPLTGRDILAVGKNYKAHAKEFQLSGFDSSDKNEQPDFPVIFTKRASSIVPTGTEIFLHPEITESVDYEGELGIIIGKGGIRIKKEDAWNHVWGAVIINDVTARERQRDHKQFYIGKSLDTFCPMGPYAVHASALDWNNLVLETKVNGEVRQHQNTSELIFDIPTLVETCSLGITLQPGDVIATGTPAGVGIGKNPPIFLKSGDKIEVTITGLGTLTNIVGPQDIPPPICAPVRRQRKKQATIYYPDSGLRQLRSGLKLHVEIQGKDSSDAPTIIFIHGLGGSSTNYSAMIDASGVYKTHRIITFDLEGHGLSPLSTGEPLTIETFAKSLGEVLDSVNVHQAAIVGHSLGGLIATTFAAKYPNRVNKLFLINPATSPTETVGKVITAYAQAVRQGGIPAVVDAIIQVDVSEKTRTSRPLSKAAVRATFLSSPPEGYVQACLAILKALEPDYSAIKVPVLIVVGAEDKMCPKATVDFLHAQFEQSQVIEMAEVAHWNHLEDWEGCAQILSNFSTFTEEIGRDANIS